MPSHLNVPAAGASHTTASSSFTLVSGSEGAANGTSGPIGTFSFAELEGKEPAQQV